MNHNHIVAQYFKKNRKGYKCIFVDGMTLKECSHSSKALCNIRVHIMSHLKLKQFMCQECDRSFVTKQNRDDHQKRHNEIRGFKCPVPGCQWSFYRKRELIIHGNSLLHKEYGVKAYRADVALKYPRQRGRK